MSDWTDQYDQEIIAETADIVVKDIIHNIFEEKLLIHRNISLSEFEISLLYRWPVYVGVNIFINRMLSVIHNKHECLYDTKFENKYFNNTAKAIQAFYYDFSINYNLFNQLSEIIHNISVKKYTEVFNHEKEQNNLEKVIPSRNYLKRFLKKAYLYTEDKYIKFYKPDFIGENSNWFRSIWIFGHCMDFSSHDFNDQFKVIEGGSRDYLKSNFSNVLSSHILKICKTLSEEKVYQCTKIFAEFMDRIIPLSLLEGLPERFQFYSTMLKEWKIKQVHAFTGFYYNENFKVFAILARRKGAKLVGHTHGANNYIKLFYKRANELYFLDYYTTYGVNKVDSDLQYIGGENVEFIPTGSTFFNLIPKWEKLSININKFTLLYASGPLMEFSSDLLEISPEKNRIHRLKILQFIENLLQKYPGLNISYKPFPGTYKNDPIKTRLSKWFDQNRIKLDYTSTIKMYSKVDIVLWDYISTGFAESVVCGVPVLAFIAHHEYNLLSARGKIVNDALIRDEVLCFDIDRAEKYFQKIIDRPSEYKKKTQKTFQMFMDDNATPVSPKEWRKRFFKAVQNSERKKE